MFNLSFDDLLKIFRDKDGIFENTINTVTSLESDFSTEQNRIRSMANAENGLINLDLTIPTLPIEQFRSNIEMLQNGENGVNLTHIGFYYGLISQTQVGRKMNLIIQGVKLDDGDGGRNLVKIPSVKSLTHFSTEDRTLRPGDVGPDQVALFKNTFNPIHEARIIHGAFIKIQALKNVLDEFLAEDFNNLKITLGFMKSDGASNPNCFHLIFRGEKAANSFSNKVFSTFDNEKGYSGPKPSRPPFGDE